MAPPGLTAADVVERLSNTRLAAEPDRVELDAASAWPRSWQTGRLSPAGVLVPLVERSAGLGLILTRRATALKHHSGQVSFPGGRMEPADADIRQTALRETREEIGVPENDVAVVGTLPAMPTITGYAVTPVVGILPASIRLVLEVAEVDRAFEVPLEFFLDEGNERRTERRIEGVSVPLSEYFYGGERIWGATAWMIGELRKVLNYSN